MTVTYGSYLALDKILGAQTPLSESEHDEMLFIVIHQVYELWFKQLLHEGAFLQRSLEKNAEGPALATLKRMRTILKTMVAQIDVLETMTPISFAGFRNRLETASGFQSVQFRMFEFFLGNKAARMVEFHTAGDAGKAAAPIAAQPDRPEVRRLKAMLGEPALYDSFLKFLALRGAKVPQDLLERDVSVPYTGDVRVQDLLVSIYRSDPTSAQICETMVDLDEGVQEWRYRHVKMVERTIGNKPGTGGSSGVEFLKRTLFRAAFPDLWEIRARF